MNTNSEKGFTLLEVLLSIAILTIVLSTFFQFFSQSMLFSSRNEEKQQATNLVRQLINEIQEDTQAYKLIENRNSPIQDSETLNVLFNSKIDNFEQMTEQFEITIVCPANTCKRENNLIPIFIKADSNHYDDVSSETYGFISLSPINKVD